MSRHKVFTDGGHWVFGWDNPLQSYYIQFYDNKKEEDENPVIWLGADLKTSMYDIEDFKIKAKEIDFNLNYGYWYSVLYTDRDEGI